MSDIIRVFRILEYVGTREKVEKTIKGSIHGEKSVEGLTIKAATLGAYPEIIKKDIGFSKGYDKGYNKGFDNSMLLDFITKVSIDIKKEKKAFKKYKDKFKKWEILNGIN